MGWHECHLLANGWLLWLRLLERHVLLERRRILACKRWLLQWWLLRWIL